MPAPSTCPLVVTVKFNGKVIAERTTMQVGVASSWESVARTRLEAVLPPETVADYMGVGLKVHLFESAAHLPSQRVNAAAGRVCRCVAFGLLLCQAMQIRS